MGGIRKRKRRRGPVLETKDPDTCTKDYLDLYVPIPRKTSAAGALLIQQILERSGTTGFSRVALTHTIYGPPRPADDKASSTIKNSYGDLYSQTGNNKRKSTPIVLCRLHAIVENLSDVGLYVLKSDQIPPNPVQELLNEYDLISLSPRNDATFQAACSSATAAEIITLDYSAGRGGVQLPFRITRSDVKAAMARGAVFEIPYTAVLNRNQRKGLIQACRLLQSASLGLQPKIIFTSEQRTVDNEDVGVLALRTPKDLINVLNAVLGWDSRSAIDMLSSNGSFAVDKGRRRQFGKSLVIGISSQPNPTSGAMESTKTPKEVHNTALAGNDNLKDVTQNVGETEQLGEDGFISF